jgi:RNA polymerase sigma-70 factor (ECF subfamily)
MIGEPAAALPWSLLLAAQAPEVEALAVLIADAATGDSESLARLYDATARELWGLALCRGANREVAADAVQDVFCRLAAGRGPRRRVRHPRAWLLACVRRAAIDRLRRHRRETDLESAPELFSAADPERSLDAQRAASAVARLPPKLREAVYLRFALDLSLAEIGRVAGIPTFTAASRVRLGVARLRVHLGVGR